MIGPLLYNRPVKNFLKFLIDTFTQPGPKEETRRKGRVILIGEVIDSKGGRAVSKSITPEAYTYTALTTVQIMKRVLNGEYKTGFQTPSLAYGADFILQFEGVAREDLL
jgi:short subunit dehydrogenase-like uncharacterized protein